MVSVPKLGPPLVSVEVLVPGTLEFGAKLGASLSSVVNDDADVSPRVGVPNEPVESRSTDPVSRVPKSSDDVGSPGPVVSAPVVDGSTGPNVSSVSPVVSLELGSGALDAEVGHAELSDEEVSLGSI